jgi:hypothetical protein
LDPALFLNYLNALTVFWETSRLELNDMITELFQPLAPYLIASVLGQIQEELVDTVLPNILHQAVQIGKLFMVVKPDMGVIVEKIAEKIRELQNTHPEIPANPFHRVLTAYQEKYQIQQKFGRKAPNDKSRSSEGTRLQTDLQTILTEFHALHASFSHQTEIKNNYRRFTKQFQSILAPKTPAELVRMNVEYYVLLQVIKAIGFFSITPQTIHQKLNKKRSSPFFSSKNRNQKHERSSNRKIRKQKQGHASIPSSRKTRKYLQEGIL